ncbi:MAG: hypothetical protein IJZ74_00775 [Clostridia bacterium]|nr:hypothetical protein [Clostridia bacterium]
MQNISYACWKTPRSLTEIAQALSVSPVYVEDMLEQMTQQGFLTEQNGRYLCAIIMTEMTAHLASISDHMYQEAAQLIAPDLFQTLQTSDIWSDPELHCCDAAFALWALIPWCIASCHPDGAIPLSTVSTIRPDGAKNLCSATFAVPGTPHARHAAHVGRILLRTLLELA